MNRCSRDPLDLLFTQFTWPLSLVRERACNALAELLIDPNSGASTFAHLLSWLKKQELESLQANGLLVLLCAQSLDRGWPLPEPSALWDHFSHPSVLSWLLYKELFPDSANQLDVALRHSGEPPSSFSISPSFYEHKDRYVPPIYAHMVEAIEGREHFPFMRQWAYEWDRIMSRLGIAPSTKIFSYWLTKKTDGEHYETSDPIISDVYRSAYLRALARVAPARALTMVDVTYLAALACPVDLDLWQIKPSARPDWWPQGKMPASELDTSVGTIWDEVADLWSQQQDVEWVLTEASGFVRRDSSVYDLEILGVFQKCLGPEEPELADIVDWYHNTAITVHCSNSLRCRGVVNEKPLERLAHVSGDWTMVPAAQSAYAAGNAPRWQSWRISRHVWLPTPGVADNEVVTFGPSNAWITTRFGDIEAGRWFDWTDGLSDHRTVPLPPPTGQALQMPRRLIDDFAQATHSTFCWVCRLTTYYRKHTYEEYSEYADYRAFGASRIVRPRE